MPTSWLGPAVGHRETSEMERSTYRGYLIEVANDGPSWSFMARPASCDLPILSRPTSGLYGSSDRALAEAKRRIDRLLVTPSA
jgi:hypothetical protein